MKKCKYWRFYKGLSPLTCGCDICTTRRELEQKEKNNKRPTVDCPDPTECEEGCIGYCSEVDDLTEDVCEFIERNS